jgi:YesN/AraC family two-component response regulator
MLEMLNYRVLTAVNGQAALALYQANKTEIAAVLTDNVMPELDGLALFQALRKDNPQVKVIFISGYPLGEEVEQLLDQDAIHVLKKPLMVEDLARILSRVLHRPDEGLRPKAK